MSQLLPCSTTLHRVFLLALSVAFLSSLFLLKVRTRYAISVYACNNTSIHDSTPKEKRQRTTLPPAQDAIVCSVDPLSDGAYIVLLRCAHALSYRSKTRRVVPACMMGHDAQ